MAIQTTFTVPTTQDYSSADGQRRFHYFSGDVVPIEVAVDLQMTGAAAVAAANAAEIAAQAFARKSDIDIESGVVVTPATNGGSNAKVGRAGNTVTGGTANTISGGGTDTNDQIISGGGAYSTIAGGYDNQITSTAVGANTIGGGAHHRIKDTATHGTIDGGSNHTIEGGADYSTIGGGTGHDINNADNATIGGGVSNSVTGNDSTIGGGNGNAASGLRATIAGGNANTAAGNDAAIGGGNTNKVYGTDGAIAGGQLGEVGSVGTPTNGNYASVGGGLSNTVGKTASAQYGRVSGGRLNDVEADYGAIPGGRENQVTGQVGHASGYGAKAAIYGSHAQAGGYFSAAGDAQTDVIVLRRQSTNATPIEMRADGSAFRLTIPNDTTWTFDVLVVARRTDADNESAAYRLVGCIDNNANTVALVGTVAQTVIAEDTAAWDVTATADNTNKALSITATGEAAKTINWVARVTIVQVTG